VESVRQGAEPPPSSHQGLPCQRRRRQLPEPRPGADHQEISAYIPAAIAEPPDYAALTIRQKHAIADIPDKLMWWAKVGKFAIFTRESLAPVIITPDGELDAIK
jgi:hypothetical protein